MVKHRKTNKEINRKKKNNGQEKIQAKLEVKCCKREKKDRKKDRKKKKLHLSNGVENLLICCRLERLVTTRMIPALRWAAMRAILTFL